MPNVSDFRAIVQGVEQAEKRGDHVAAERLLRQALALQEASVGPNHPEVANILNNLAIVCEINGKLTDAEASYRRAYAIATSRYPANDPFVTTSRENLEQFCTARGIPFKQTPPTVSAASGATAVPAPAAPAPTPPPPAASSAPPRPAPPPPKTAAPAPKIAAPAPKAAVPPPSRAAAPPSLDDFPLRTSPAVPATLRTLGAPAATREPSRTPMIAAVIAVLVIVLAGAWYLFSSNTERTASTPSPSLSPSSSAAPPPASPSPPAPAEPVRETEPAPAETASATAPAATEPVAPPPTPAPTAPPAVAPEPPAATARTSGVDVVSAELCRSLTTSGAWKCAPPTGTVAPGPMVFYTRVASGRDTTIEHRWYRDDRLHQSVPLRIRANPSGFRTYSRTTITPDRTGTWKVELRTQGGDVLDEKTFVVR